MSALNVRPMKTADLDDVVELHLEGFPGFFLSILGPRFLKLLYSEILKRPDHVAMVAVDPTRQVTGFVAGVAEQSHFYSHLIRRRSFAFAVASLSAVIRNPRILPRLFRSLKYPRQSRTASAQALLMSIAVKPDMAGKGVGRLLVTAFLEAMSRKGAAAVSLTTDRDSNDRTNRFYQELGFRIDRVFVTAEGRRMNEYKIEIPVVSSGLKY